jgi:hypothetical protein
MPKTDFPDDIDESGGSAVSAEPVALGRGHRAKTGSKRYDGWVDSDLI